MRQHYPTATCRQQLDPCEQVDCPHHVPDVPGSLLRSLSTCGLDIAEGKQSAWLVSRPLVVGPEPTAEQFATWADVLDAEPVRPRTRGDCVKGPRPCPWISCRHHLAVEVTKSGTLVDGVQNGRIDDDDAFVDRLVEMRATCSLDVADHGAHTAADTARALGVERQAVSALEGALLDRLAVSRHPGPRRLAILHAHSVADSPEVWDWAGRTPGDAAGPVPWTEEGALAATVEAARASGGVGVGDGAAAEAKPVLGAAAGRRGAVPDIGAADALMEVFGLYRVMDEAVGAAEGA